MGPARVRKEAVVKRYFVLGIALALAVAMVTALTGCGGDTGKAKEYMKKGDKYLAEVSKNSEDLEKKLTETFTESDFLTSEAFKSASGDIEADIDDIVEGADKAKAEYEKILVLKGVPDYVTYAGIQIEVIEKGKEVMEKTVSLLSQVESFLVKAESGEPVDQQTITTAITKASSEMETLGEEMGELQKEAEKLKEDKSL